MRLDQEVKRLQVVEAVEELRHLFGTHGGRPVLERYVPSRAQAGERYVRPPRVAGTSSCHRSGWPRFGMALAFCGCRPGRTGQAHGGAATRWAVEPEPARPSLSGKDHNHQPASTSTGMMELPAMAISV